MFSEDKYTGFPPEVRITHNIHMVSFILIALTGFYIHYPINILGFTGVKWVGFAHTVSAIFLYASFVFRLYYAFATGNYVNFKFLREDSAKTWEWLKYYLFLSKEKPVKRKYNPLQKLTYYIFIVLLIFQAFTGLALLETAAFGWVMALFGGRQMVRTIQFFLAVALSSIVAVHLYLVFTAADQRQRQTMFALGRIREREQ
ncbi:MAG: cytochrome b/b6 domain-containing protein [Firmicutes bacterium]|nr:cytochrome b/b6 domain-containing protein [Bacillota bacterium]